MSKLNEDEIDVVFTLSMMSIVGQFVQCGFCGTYLMRHNFIYHYYQHIEYKPYECKKCLKSYYSPGNLQRHKTIHRH